MLIALVCIIPNTAIIDVYFTLFKPEATDVEPRRWTATTDAAATEWWANQAMAAQGLSLHFLDNAVRSQTLIPLTAGV